MTPGLGDQPVEQEYLDTMTVVVKMIDELFNGDARGPARKVGFVMMVFKFGAHDMSRCNYMSNGADRKDVVALMKEMVARFEGQPEMKGRA